MQPLRLEFGVACPPERAFEIWAERTSLWWAHGHSVSGEPGLSVTFETRPGGASSSAPRRERNRKGWAGVTEHYMRWCEGAA